VLLSRRLRTGSRRETHRLERGRAADAAGTGALKPFLSDVEGSCSLAVPSSAAGSLGGRQVPGGTTVAMTTPATSGDAPLEGDAGEAETRATTPCTPWSGHRCMSYERDQRWPPIAA
jgi:hypothetical protein